MRFQRINVGSIPTGRRLEKIILVIMFRYLFTRRMFLWLVFLLIMKLNVPTIQKHYVGKYLRPLLEQIKDFWL